jgi:hypothetical protein
MEKRACPECQEPISGRTDKKFCSDLCRNAYNNRINSDSNSYIRNVNNALRRNRRILASSLDGEKSMLSRQKLADKGFNFRYCTHHTVTKNNHTYIFCYEYGYLPVENDMVLVVKRQDGK